MAAPSFKKLRVGGDSEALGGAIGDGISDPLVRSHRDGALEDHDLIPVHGPADRFGDTQHVGHVRGAVLTRWCTDSDEDDLRGLYRFRKVGSKRQPFFLEVSLEQFLESRLVDRAYPF